MEIREIGFEGEEVVHEEELAVYEIYRGNGLASIEPLDEFYKGGMRLLPVVLT